MSKHRSIVSSLGLLAALALASPALAQSSASADANASSALASKVEQRAAQVSSDQMAQTDAKLAAQAKKLDASASGSGAATVATRLSKEFGVSADALSAERAQFDMGWGQIMIAHTLEASASGTTADQLLTLRQSGMGWGEIAAGLGLSLGKSVSAVNAESQVALGQAKADGQVARIAGAGAAANVNAASGAHLPAAASTQASVHAGLGLGLGR